MPFGKNDANPYSKNAAPLLKVTRAKTMTTWEDNRLDPAIKLTNEGQLHLPLTWL